MLGDWHIEHRALGVGQAAGCLYCRAEVSGEVHPCASFLLLALLLAEHWYIAFAWFCGLFLLLVPFQEHWYEVASKVPFSVALILSFGKLYKLVFI